ncbi:hypothetical protein [Sphingomonas oryzagri]|uniref:Uncharacterized protein n=1 Tax=Sphingomonas oryzagri TaxID=3042314 RepID=A0ABT6N0W0_9SPHN|nr:hypothetical protein [Sphingomonas oryzagri]MDH7638949.1 hypothetical protein [Sphingomonas oryzagri]
MKLAEVVTLYESNARDIPAMLRTAAASIESEADEGFSPTRAIVAVQVAENGKIQVYGWGETEAMDSIALLNMGAASLTHTLLAQQED